MTTTMRNPTRRGQPGKRPKSVGLDEPATGREDPGPPGVARRMTFVLYEDNSGGWRWRLASHRGEVLAESGTSYTRERNALEAIHSIQTSTVGAKVEKQP